MRRGLVFGVLACASVVVFIVLQHTPAVAADAVDLAERALVKIGVPPSFVQPGRVEFVLNSLMFVPLAALAALTWPRHPWANWIAYAFVSSCAIELYQGLVLPPRSAQFVDIVANTSGAIVGVLAARALVLVAGTRQDGRPSV